jgi:D-glycero-D-manno-heptose 1,7-bisphosphate phosphatase
MESTAATRTLLTPMGRRNASPPPVLAEKATRELKIDPSISFFIGDRWSDVECGRRAGFRTVLVETGTSDPEPECQRARETADFVFPDLALALDQLLEEKLP